MLQLFNQSWNYLDVTDISNQSLIRSPFSPLLIPLGILQGEQREKGEQRLDHEVLPPATSLKGTLEMTVSA